MPTKTLTKHQARWQDLIDDPSLQNLPYKVETNERGQLVLSPHKNRHSHLQKALLRLLDRHAPNGESFPEYALATPKGVKVPDVIWMSPRRKQEMQKTGDPSARAPEVCVEIMSASNTEEEFAEKRALYRAIGAEEVWIVSEEGTIRFFGEEESDSSRIAPDCPAEVDVD